MEKRTGLLKKIHILRGTAIYPGPIDGAIRHEPKDQSAVPVTKKNIAAIYGLFMHTRPHSKLFQPPCLSPSFPSYDAGAGSTTMLTLRFFALPSGVPLEAEGRYSEYPDAESRAGAIPPAEIRCLSTLVARAVDSSQLL